MDASMEEYTERVQACFIAAFRRATSDHDLTAQFGITRPQFYIMGTLAQEGTCKVTKLAEMMEVKPSAVTVMIDRLVKHGLVARLIDDHDRRVVLLQLTEEGNITLQQAKAIQMGKLAARLNKIDKKDLEQFLNTFEAIML